MSSKRTLQHKFHQWGFPRKHTIDKDDPKLQERIRELWAQNLSHGEILQMLVETDGYDITDKDLARLRKKNNLLIRVGRPGQNKGVKRGKYRKETANNGSGDGESSDNDEGSSSLSSGSSNESNGDEDHEIASQLEDGSVPNSHRKRRKKGATTDDNNDASRDGLGTRLERKRQLEQESAELWATKKRRRRIKPRGGLPADPPQPPRFPSELTLEESKIFLLMEDGTLYNEIRDQFQRVCEDNDVIKKTTAGPEKWEMLKDQLIQETPHLKGQLWGPAVAKEGLDQRKLSLDVICMDVTKRMRSAGRRLTVGGAKNILGWNPKVGRDMKEKFQEILRKDHYFSIVETGEKRWKQLMQRWTDANPEIQVSLNPPEGPGKYSHQERVRAVDFLARDAAKRYKNDITRKYPTQMEAPKTFAFVHGGEKISAKDASTERAKQLREAVKNPSTLATAMNSRPPPPPIPTATATVAPPLSVHVSSGSAGTIPPHMPQPPLVVQLEPPQPRETAPSTRQSQQSIQQNTRPQRQSQQIQPLQSQRQTRSISHSRLVASQPSLMNPEPDLSLESQLGLLAGQQPATQPYMSQPPLTTQQQPAHQAQSQFLDLSMQPLSSMPGMPPMQLQQPQFAPPLPPAQMYRPQPPADMAVFIRQAQTPEFGSQMNIATLSAGAGVAGVRREAVTLANAQGAICDRVQGIVKGKNGSQELGIEIRSDDELGAYLGHVNRSEGGAALFDVRLRWGTA